MSNIVLGIFLTMQILCGNPIIINNTNEWTSHDQKTFAFSQKRCGIIYTDAPCLKKFIKISFKNYHAVCGE